MTSPAEHAATVREAIDYYSGEAGIEVHPQDEALEALDALVALAERATELERVEQLETALRASAVLHHRASAHPRDFSICTWRECRKARAALAEADRLLGDNQ